MIATVDHVERIRSETAEIWRPRKRVRMRDWIPANVHLSNTVEAVDGDVEPYEVRPYLVDILNALDDPDVFEVTVRKSTQVGGTVTLQAIAMHLAVNDPAPMLVVLPDREEAVIFRDRIYANALASPTTRHLVPRRHFWTTRWVELGPMLVYLAWAGSRQRLRGRACRVVCMSEKDAYDSKKKEFTKPSEAARERVKSFPRHTIYNESSPDTDDSEIDRDYRRGDQRVWWAPCPLCGRWQQLRFFLLKSGPLAGRGGIAGYQDSSGNMLETEDARAGAFYRCLSNCKITSDRKAEFVDAGRWAPKGQKVDDAGRLVGKRARPKRHSSFWPWTIMSPRLDFGYLAATYVERYVNARVGDFLKGTLGLPSRPPSKMPTWKRAASRLKWNYDYGTVPDDVWFLTAGIDVQRDCIYWSVYGWGHLATVYLIDNGRLDRVVGEPEEEAAKDDPEDLDDEPAQIDYGLPWDKLEPTILAKSWPVVHRESDDRIETTPGVNPLGKTALRVRLAGVDTGHQIHQVHEWWRSLSDRDRRRVRLVKGDDKVKPEKMWEYSFLEKNTRTGKPYEGGLSLWRLYVSGFKVDLADRISGDPKSDGGFRLPFDVLPKGAQHLRQLVNEHFVNGEWKERSKAVGNHGWDTTVYARAMADMLAQGRTWDTAKWQRKSSRGKGRGRGSRREGQQNLSAR